MIKIKITENHRCSAIVQALSIFHNYDTLMASQFAGYNIYNEDNITLFKCGTVDEAKRYMQILSDSNLTWDMELPLSENLTNIIGDYEHNKAKTRNTI